MLPGVILAGGRSRRMGGGDKGLARLGRGNLLDAVAARCQPQLGALALNANGDPARFAGLGLPVLSDLLPDVGPLGGVLTALDWAAGQGASRVVTVPGDTPFLPDDLVACLVAVGEGAPTAPILAASASGLHPTCGLWPVALRDELRMALLSGTRRMRDWAEEHGARRAHFAGEAPDPFFNVNTPEDLRQAQAWADH